MREDGGGSPAGQVVGLVALSRGSELLWIAVDGVRAEGEAVLAAFDDGVVPRQGGDTGVLAFGPGASGLAAGRAELGRAVLRHGVGGLRDGRAVRGEEGEVDPVAGSQAEIVHPVDQRFRGLVQRGVVGGAPADRFVRRDRPGETGIHQAARLVVLRFEVAPEILAVGKRAGFVLWAGVERVDHGARGIADGQVQVRELGPAGEADLPQGLALFHGVALAYLDRAAPQVAVL